MCSFLSALFLLLPTLSDCITVRYDHQKIISKSKVELSPMLITSQLSDFAIIAAPVVDAQSLHYLHKPNGDTLKLTISNSTTLNTPMDKNTVDIETDDHYFKDDNIVVKYINRDVKSIYPIKNHRVVSSRQRIGNGEDVGEALSTMAGNEFAIGPLQAEDHGNWVLSVYFKSLDDQWTEIFQVITIEIIEHVPLKPRRPTLKLGSTFNLSFAYPIEDLESCELTAPRSSYDRFFDRSRIELDKCGYVVSNVSEQDEGLWRILGVGKIVYDGIVDLKVIS